MNTILARSALSVDSLASK